MHLVVRQHMLYNPGGPDRRFWADSSSLGIFNLQPPASPPLTGFNRAQSGPIQSIGSIFVFVVLQEKEASFEDNIEQLLGQLPYNFEDSRTFLNGKCDALAEPTQRKHYGPGACSKQSLPAP